MLNDSSSLTQLKGIGDKTAKLYEKLGIRTIGELLRYLPKDYETFDMPKNINQVRAGEVCSVCGVIAGSPIIKKVKHFSIYSFIVKDQTGTIQITFFNSPFIQNVLKPGMRYVFRGKIQVRMASFVMEQPAYYLNTEYMKLTGVLQPRYSLTKGLTHQAIQKAVQNALSQYQMTEDYLPSDIQEKITLMPYRDSLQGIHFPKSRDEAIQARERFVFEEFF